MTTDSVQKRRGFAYLWVLAVAAIIAILAAAVLPKLASQNDTKRVAAAAKTLDSLSADVNLFFTSVTMFPGKLSHLTAAILSTDVNSCWATYGGGNAGKWVGPYAGFLMPPAGLYTPIGRIRDSVPNRNANRNDSIWIEIPGINVSDARLLDAYVDGTSDSTKDTVRFHAPVGGTTTVRFRVTPSTLNKC